MIENSSFNNVKCTVSEKRMVINLLKEYVVLDKKDKLNLLSEQEKELYESLRSSLILLSRREKEVIKRTYIENEDETFDYIIKDKLKLSARTYYRIKDSAINKIYNFLPSYLFDIKKTKQI